MGLWASALFLSPLPFPSLEPSGQVWQLLRRKIRQMKRLTQGKPKTSGPSCLQASVLASPIVLHRFSFYYWISSSLYPSSAGCETEFGRRQRITLRSCNTRRQNPGRTSYSQRSHPHLCPFSRECVNFCRFTNIRSPCWDRPSPKILHVYWQKGPAIGYLGFGSCFRATGLCWCLWLRKNLFMALCSVWPE